MLPSMAPGANGRRSLSEVAKVASVDLVDLIVAQLALARLEVSADLRVALERLVRVALFVPPLVIGYAFGMAALASQLGVVWSRPVALAAVGGLQFAVAGAGILWSLAALGRTPILRRAAAGLAGGVQQNLAAVSGRVRSSGV